ncbi:MAG: DUF6785 family protein [Armatimonadota bacterium]
MQCDTAVTTDPMIKQTEHREPVRSRGPTPIGARALVIGVLTVAGVSLGCPYFGAVTHTWDPGGSALPATGVVVLFALVLLNGALARLVPRLAMNRVELLVTYAMVIMTTQFLYKGGVPFITGATTFPFYMATPANDWEHRVWPHIPLWLRLSDAQAVTWYWEGLPAGAAVPWAAWKWPLLAWGSFSLAMMAAMFCLSALLSRDWIERQRLAFPLAEIPVAITGESDTPTVGRSILRNRLAWIGFAVPTLTATLGWLHSVNPGIPTVPLEFPVEQVFAGMGLPWSAFGGESGVHVSIVFPLIGIAYLLPGEVSLSLWLFYVLYRLQELVWASIGVAPGGRSSIGVDPQTFIGMQEAGGFIALSAAVLYQSRRTLAAAWQGLVRRRLSSDPVAPPAPPWALLGFMLANVYLLLWASHAGMPWWPFALIMGLFYTVMIGVSRLVAAAGLTHVDTGIYPRTVILRTIGAAPLGPPSLVVFGYLGTAFMYDPRIVLMAQAMNSFKLLHAEKVQARRFPWAAASAVLVTLAVGFPALLVIAYHHGASMLPDWPMASPQRWIWGEIDASLRTPELPDNWSRAALGIGVAMMGGLIALHTRFLWWPVSPVGFLIASGWSTDRFVWSNALIGWALATLVRRYGGLRMYRTLRPAFLGLVLGGYVPQMVFALLSPVLGVRPPE